MKTIKTKKMFRSVVLDREHLDLENRSVSVAFSSEEPVERFFGKEVLDHNPESIRLGRLIQNGPLLLEHDPSNQIGVVDSVEIGPDKVGRAIVRFSKGALASEVFQDVQDGIRKSISVGYQIHNMKDEGDNVFRSYDWEPMEISLVSIPADISAGVGRSEENNYETQIIEREVPKMEAQKNTETKVETPKVDIESIQSEARKKEQTRIREISAMGKQFKREEIANKFIESGKPVEEFRAVLLEDLGAEPIVNPSPDIGLTEKEAQRFSFLRAINASANGNWTGAEFEKEVSETVEKEQRKVRTQSGFYVPNEVLKRDLTAGTNADGGFTVSTDLMSGSFIDMLRNSMLVRELGATIMDGLQGNIAIPKQSGGSSAYWVAENGAITESQQTLAQVTLSPKTVGAYTDMSHRLITQSSIDMENFVRRDIATTLAVAIDLASINGSGSSNQPTGVMNTSSIGSVAGGTNGLAPTYAHMVDLESAVSQDNALQGSLAYLTNAKVVGKLKQTEKASNTAQYVWENGTVNGYRAMMSNQVPSNLTKGSSSGVCSAVIFGNWNDLIIGQWGVMDFLVDPYTGSSAGTVRVRAMMDVDIAVRHPESFAVMADALTA